MIRGLISHDGSNAQTDVASGVSVRPERCEIRQAGKKTRAAKRHQPALLVSSSYSAAESRSVGSAASPLPSWATRTRNIQPDV
jgi:hypothetical protein